MKKESNLPFNGKELKDYGFSGVTFTLTPQQLSILRATAQELDEAYHKIRELENAMNKEVHHSEEMHNKYKELVDNTKQNSMNLIVFVMQLTQTVKGNSLKDDEKSLFYPDPVEEEYEGKVRLGSDEDIFN